MPDHVLLLGIMAQQPVDTPVILCGTHGKTAATGQMPYSGSNPVPVALLLACCSIEMTLFSAGTMSCAYGLCAFSAPCQYAKQLHIEALIASMSAC